MFDVEVGPEEETCGVTCLGLDEPAGEVVDFDCEENFVTLTQVFEDFRRSAR